MGQWQGRHIPFSFLAPLHNLRFLNPRTTSCRTSDCGWRKSANVTFAKVRQEAQRKARLRCVSTKPVLSCRLSSLSSLILLLFSLLPPPSHFPHREPVSGNQNRHRGDFGNVETRLRRGCAAGGGRQRPAAARRRGGRPFGFRAAVNSSVGARSGFGSVSKRSCHGLAVERSLGALNDWPPTFLRYNPTLVFALGYGSDWGQTRKKGRESTSAYFRLKRPPKPRRFVVGVTLGSSEAARGKSRGRTTREPALPPPHHVFPRTLQ